MQSWIKTVKSMEEQPEVPNKSEAKVCNGAN